jgi:hypothetical protein
MDAEFCTTNGFADFCRNKSQACGRQRQIALIQVVVLALTSFSPQENEAGYFYYRVELCKVF